jgi:Polyketide cyclase / dehydrase and lipid transport
MTILIIVIVIIAIPLILAFFLDNEYVIERNIVIDRPKEDVFNFVKFVKNAEYFNKWVMMDPQMKKEYKGTDGSAGFIYSWDSNNKNVGKGEQEITKISDRRIDYEIRFRKPMEGIAEAYLATEPVSSGQTKVTWVFKGKRSYAMKIMHLLLNLKKMLGRDLATGLSTLKSVLEKK